MLSKTERNFYLHIALLLLGIVIVLTGIALSLRSSALRPFLRALHIRSLHEWVGYALTVLVIIHLVFHMDWIKATAKKIFTMKKKT